LPSFCNEIPTFATFPILSLSLSMPRHESGRLLLLYKSTRRSPSPSFPPCGSATSWYALYTPASTVMARARHRWGFPATENGVSCIWALWLMLQSRHSFSRSLARQQVIFLACSWHEYQSQHHGMGVDMGMGMGMGMGVHMAT
jgi:hypothetical protein